MINKGKDYSNEIKAIDEQLKQEIAVLNDRIMHVKNTLTKKIQGLDAFEEIYA